MKNVLIAAGAAALLAASSLTALAEEATGTIASIDVTAGTVTLDDGTLDDGKPKVYRLPTTVALANLKVGQQVKIIFEGQGSPLMASAISLAPTLGDASPVPGAAPLSGGNAGPANNPGAPGD
jgi:Cu/Ag efflux protein CusF